MELHCKCSLHFVFLVYALHHSPYCANQYCLTCTPPSAYISKKREFSLDYYPRATVEIWKCILSHTNTINAFQKKSVWEVPEWMLPALNEARVPQCLGLPSLSLWNWDCVMSHIKQCSPSSSCAVTSSHLVVWVEEGPEMCHLVDTAVAHFEAGYSFWGRSLS